MGYKEHFVGLVQEGRIVDLFGEDSTVCTCSFPDGSIVEVSPETTSLLAKAGSAEAALYRLAADKKLDPVFPPQVHAQVESLLNDDGINDPSLVDMSHLPFVTIDGEDSLDLDQALFVEESESGFVVHYALADASYYVKPGTPLHREALARGASYYLPGFMVPMLPRALSEGLISLNAKVMRRAVVFSMTLTREGLCTHTEVLSARIRSRHKLSFGRVQAFYEENLGFDSEVDTSLRHLATVGTIRMQLAEERGVVRYRRREVKATLSSGGVRFSATSAVRHEVERYNEQLSLLCNIEGARYLSENGADYIEPIYRVHPSPSKEKMRTFETQLKALVTAQKLPPQTWLWTEKHPLPLRQFLDNLPSEGSEGRIAMAIHRQAVMANVRSNFQTDEGKHHGVGAEVYARFSAPMREMVGVFLHKELLEAKAKHGQADPGLRSQVVSQANKARSLQRDVTSEGNRLVLEQLFRDALQSKARMRGTLMGAQGSKAYVRLDEPPIDVKVYLKLGPNKLKPSKGGAILLDGDTPVFCLGDAVDISVLQKDAERDRWVLELSPPKSS